MKLKYLTFTIFISLPITGSAMELTTNGDTLSFDQVIQSPPDLACEYLLREDCELSETQSALVLTKCLQDGHPLAQLWEIENKMLDKIVFEATKLVRPVSSQTQFCCRYSPPKDSFELIPLTEDQITVKNFTLEEKNYLSTLACEALQQLINNPLYEKYFKILPENLGPLGFLPYEDFADKTSLEREDFIKLHSFWWQQYNTRGNWEKHCPDSTVRCAFEDQYPCFLVWLDLMRYTATPETGPQLAQLINTFQLKLHALPEETFSGGKLPWWRNPMWRLRTLPSTTRGASF